MNLTFGWGGIISFSLFTFNITDQIKYFYGHYANSLTFFSDYLYRVFFNCFIFSNISISLLPPKKQLCLLNVALQFRKFNISRHTLKSFTVYFPTVCSINRQSQIIENQKRDKIEGFKSEKIKMRTLIELALLYRKVQSQHCLKQNFRDEVLENIQGGPGVKTLLQDIDIRYKPYMKKRNRRPFRMTSLECSFSSQGNHKCNRKNFC